MKININKLPLVSCWMFHHPIHFLPGIIYTHHHYYNEHGVVSKMIVSCQLKQFIIRSNVKVFCHTDDRAEPQDINKSPHHLIASGFWSFI